MSLVHWDKSILTFHLKEIIEDHNQGNTNSLVGLGAILLGTTIIPATAHLGRPLLKSIIKTGLSLYEEGKSSVNSPKIKSDYPVASPPLNRVHHHQDLKIPVESKQ